MADWTLIYSSDAQGKAVKGSVNALRLAVVNGADVKILYSTGSSLWWSRYCSSVTSRVQNGNPLVAATYVQALDTTGVNGNLEFAQGGAIEYHIYNSTGMRVMMKNGSVQRGVVPMKWYVKDYDIPWFVHIDLLAKILDEPRP
jgi:hypothetical protein